MRKCEEVKVLRAKLEGVGSVQDKGDINRVDRVDRDGGLRMVVSPLKNSKIASFLNVDNNKQATLNQQPIKHQYQNLSITKQFNKPNRKSKSKPTSQNLLNQISKQNLQQNLKLKHNKNVDNNKLNQRSQNNSRIVVNNNNNSNNNNNNININSISKDNNNAFVQTGDYYDYYDQKPSFNQLNYHNNNTNYQTNHNIKTKNHHSTTSYNSPLINKKQSISSNNNKSISKPYNKKTILIIPDVKRPMSPDYIQRYQEQRKKMQQKIKQVYSNLLLAQKRQYQQEIQAYKQTYEKLIKQINTMKQQNNELLNKIKLLQEENFIKKQSVNKTGNNNKKQQKQQKHNFYRSPYKRQEIVKQDKTVKLRQVKKNVSSNNKVQQVLSPVSNNRTNRKTVQSTSRSISTRYQSPYYQKNTMKQNMVNRSPTVTNNNITMPKNRLNSPELKSTSRFVTQPITQRQQLITETARRYDSQWENIMREKRQKEQRKTFATNSRQGNQNNQEDQQQYLQKFIEQLKETIRMLQINLRDKQQRIMILQNENQKLINKDSKHSQSKFARNKQQPSNYGIKELNQNKRTKIQQNNSQPASTNNNNKQATLFKNVQNNISSSNKSYQHQQQLQFSIKSNQKNRQKIHQLMSVIQGLEKNNVQLKSEIMKKQTQINYIKSELRLKEKEVQEYKVIIKMVGVGEDYKRQEGIQGVGVENSQILKLRQQILKLQQRHQQIIKQNKQLIKLSFEAQNQQAQLNKLLENKTKKIVELEKANQIFKKELERFYEVGFGEEEKVVVREQIMVMKEEQRRQDMRNMGQGEQNEKLGQIELDY